MRFIFVPITRVVLSVPAEKSNVAAPLINFMRNVGSSVGTSMVTNLTARRAQFHQPRKCTLTLGFIESYK